MLLTSSPQELQETLDEIVGCMAIVEPDAQGHCQLLAANAQFFEMMHCNLRAPGPRARLVDYLPRYAHPAFQQAIANCLASRLPEDFRQAFDHLGRTSWWRVHVKPLVASIDGVDRMRLMIGAIDITDAIALAERLRCEQARYQALVDTAYDGVITVDRRQHIKLVNAAAAAMFGHAAEAMPGMHLNALIPPRFRGRHPEYIEQFGRSPIRSRHMFERGEVLCLRQDGSEFPAEISISKIVVEDEVEFTAVIRDISERCSLLDELKLRASTDPLTGLRNRRYALEIGETLFAGAERQERPLAVLMVDIDHFKRINDAHGHPCGDAVLVELARRLDGERRKGDVLARFGGEEFLVLLAETSLDQAQAFAERLRAAVAGEAVLPGGGIALAVSCSIGVAVTQAGDAHLEDTVARADQQLYRAKQAGRNCVRA